MSRDASLADRLLADEPALVSSLDFGPFVAQGIGDGPSLLIGDASEISLLQSARLSNLDHRMAHLAKTGDVVLVRARDTQFESYLKKFRGFDSITFLGADPVSPEPVAKQALASKPLLRRLADVARQNGGLTITAYLTTGSIWRLAKAIGEAAGCVVHVNGPSPRVSKRANDKLWFTQLAKTKIGDEAVPPTMSAYGPKAAVAQIQLLGKDGKHVIVKVPDSAGSAGNIRLDPITTARLSSAQIETLLMDRLHDTGWADIYPILVGVWDSDVTCSPSVQLWLPLLSDGPPVEKGVFEQSVLGEAAAFVGATRSTLPDRTKDILIEQALAIATVLQRLGYFGRCSFDTVICGRRETPESIHWIECNGRWSGVSIPMEVMRSIVPGGTPGGLVILQQRLAGPPITTSRAVHALRDILHDGQRSDEGVILLSPPNGLTASTANLLVLARSQSDAVQMGDQAIRLLEGN